jgi:hypothetical protein
MRTLVFDIETNAIDFSQWRLGDLSSLHTIHCMVFIGTPREAWLMGSKR